MDSGIAGFFLVLVFLIVFIYLLWRRYRVVENFIISKGFEKADRCPAHIQTLLDKLISREPELCYIASKSSKWDNDTCIIQLKDNPADEDSTVECALVTCLSRPAQSNFILCGFLGADASSLIGNAGVRLNELGSQTLKDLHRLEDKGKVLSFNDYGFVGYSSKKTDIAEILPAGLMSALSEDTAKHVWHLAVEDNHLIIHTSWSKVSTVLDYTYRLKQFLEA